MVRKGVWGVLPIRTAADGGAVQPSAGAAPGIRRVSEFQRTLTFWDLLVYGLVFMVPVAPMAVYGQVVSIAHGMVVLVYALGVVGMAATALSYAAMSAAFPVAGSVYSYVGRGWHRYAGFLAGWMIILDYVLLPALLCRICAAWLGAWLPGVPGWVWVVSLAAVCAAVNVAGIQVTNRVNWVILAVELAAFCTFCGAAVAYVTGGHGVAFTTRPVFDASRFQPGLVGSAASVAVLGFLGFDGISTLAEENRGGRQAVGRATVCSLLLVGLMFMALTYLAAVAVPGAEHFADPDTAFYRVAGIVGGPWLRLVCLAVTVTACAANAMTAQAAIARLLFGMGRDGALPRWFAQVHPRFRTPALATCLVAAVTVAVGVALSLTTLSTLVNFGALSAFLLLHAAVFTHFIVRSRSRRWFRHLLVPAFGFAVLAYVWLHFDHSTLATGLAWALAGALTLALRARRQTWDVWAGEAVPSQPDDDAAHGLGGGNMIQS
ncbi:MAG: APC family permease [Alicyclobacillaceae bacterium]|nr:APC family permease [Alicyclobacillaceae bacterium]